MTASIRGKTMAKGIQKIVAILGIMIAPAISQADDGSLGIETSYLSNPIGSGMYTMALFGGFDRSSRPPGTKH